MGEMMESIDNRGMTQMQNSMESMHITTDSNDFNMMGSY